MPTLVSILNSRLGGGFLRRDQYLNDEEHPDGHAPFLVMAVFDALELATQYLNEAWYPEGQVPTLATAYRALELGTQ